MTRGSVIVTVETVSEVVAEDIKTVVDAGVFIVPVPAQTQSSTVVRASSASVAVKSTSSSGGSSTTAAAVGGAVGGLALVVLVVVVVVAVKAHGRRENKPANGKSDNAVFDMEDLQYSRTAPNPTYAVSRPRLPGAPSSDSINKLDYENTDA